MSGKSHSGVLFVYSVLGLLLCIILVLMFFDSRERVYRRGAEASMRDYVVEVLQGTLGTTTPTCRRIRPDEMKDLAEGRDANPLCERVLPGRMYSCVATIGTSKGGWRTASACCDQDTCVGGVRLEGIDL